MRMVSFSPTGPEENKNIIMKFLSFQNRITFSFICSFQQFNPMSVINGFKLNWIRIWVGWVGKNQPGKSHVAPESHIWPPNKRLPTVGSCYDKFTDQTISRFFHLFQFLNFYQFLCENKQRKKKIKTNWQPFLKFYQFFSF